MSEINLKETDTPTTPTANRHKIFVGTTAHIKKLDSAGNVIDFNVSHGSITVLSITIKQSDVNHKYITLPTMPVDPQAVSLSFVGGTVQLNGIDFIVVGDQLSWDGLGLDGFIEKDDQIIVTY
jgi:hypothetical protein